LEAVFPGGASVKAKYFMSAPVITVNADTTLKEIVQLLSAHEISGVPVVDSVGKMIGMIGWQELLPGMKIVRSPDIRIPMLFKEIVDPQNMVDSYKQSVQLSAKDIMSPSPVCAEVNDHIGEVIWTMAQHHLHMIPILDSENLVGVFTHRDFIRFLAQEV
jgi:CBS-domain-containing membrane protein